MTAKNKWNNKIYKIVEIAEKTVKLQRESGEVFEISKSDFLFNYRVEK